MSKWVFSRLLPAPFPKEGRRKSRFFVVVVVAVAW